MGSTDHLLITCEHGGNRVPGAYCELFRPYFALLHSHRGYDRGALRLARTLARALASPLFCATTTRLLVDLNRSLGHPRLFSEITRAAAAPVRQTILEDHYFPYRRAVEGHITHALQRGSRVIHISVHSFTPVFDGQVRDADVGILYDPRRAGEAAFCLQWQSAMRGAMPELTVRRNYPYRGTADGFTTYLRRHFDEKRYVGIELEVNQRHVSGSAVLWASLLKLLVESLRQASNSKFESM